MSETFREFALHLTVFDEHIAVAEPLAKAYARRIRLEAAEVARTHKVMHGDHYAGYFDPSNDGQAIANAILAIEV